MVGGKKRAGLTQLLHALVLALALLLLAAADSLRTVRGQRQNQTQT